MRGKIHQTESSSEKMANMSEGLNLKNIRPAMLCYTLAYTFELIFYTYYQSFLHVDSTLFGIDPSTLMYVGHMLMSLVIMLLWSKRFKHLIYISLALTVLSFSAFFLFPHGIPKLLCAVLTMAGLGGCVTSARCGFAFAANNAERLLGVVLMLAANIALSFLGAILPDGSFWDKAVFLYIYPVLSLAGLAVCLLFFREKDLEFKEESSPADSKGLYWAFAIFIAFFALAEYLPFMGSGSHINVTLVYGIGKTIALVLFLFILLLLKKNVWHTWNLFLVIAVLTAALALFIQYPIVDTAVYLSKGVFYIGWVTVLYMLACAQRRFASLKLLKRCTLIFVIVSPLTTLSDDLVRMLFPEQMPLVTLVYVLIITVAFLLASPGIYKYLFAAMWMDDLQKNDMTLLREKVEQTDRFEHYGLTPREKEVAALLLAANTVRMIAGELKISQSTVNMHTANLYRKLNINSKAELFKMFGVAEEAELKI